MGITTVPSVVTGQTYSAANYNTQVRDNINGIWVLTTAGDMLYATGAAAANRLALVTNGVMIGGASAPAWLAAPATIGILKGLTGNLPSWLTGGNAYDVLRKTSGNTDVEFGVPYSHHCVVREASNFSHTSGIITWDTDVLDPQGLHDPGSNPSRITIAATGIYVIGFVVNFTPPSGGLFEGPTSGVFKNGSLLPESRQGNTIEQDGVAKTVSLNAPPVALTAGDYLELSVTFGGSRTVIADYTRFFLYRIG
jgi:hypothetical protein